MASNAPPAADPVIVVRDVVKRFGSLTAVDGVSFTVKKGEVFGILGPNGAGKTTVLECIEGLQKPTTGSIQVMGFDVQREANRVKERIGIQLQASAYFDFLTLREILRLFGRFYARSVEPDKLLERVGLMEKADTTVGKLSGGQKQRFTIAATLVNDPDVVFLDEPTTGLDPKARHSLWDFVQLIHRDGHTVVLTTHYMEEAQALCQRVAIMDQGKIVAMDTPDNLVRSLPSPYDIRVRTDREAPLDLLRTMDGVVGVDRLEDGFVSIRSSEAARTLPAFLTWAQTAGVGLNRLEVKPATLEDVFLALTGRGLLPNEEEHK